MFVLGVVAAATMPRSGRVSYVAEATVAGRTDEGSRVTACKVMIICAVATGTAQILGWVIMSGCCC